MYYNGQGVTQDYIMSYMWLNLAVAQGTEGASTLGSILEREMTPEQIAEAWRLSRELKVKSLQSHETLGAIFFMFRF
jgi:hypothetical protein